MCYKTVEYCSNGCGLSLPAVYFHFKSGCKEADEVSRDIPPKVLIRNIEEDKKNWMCDNCIKSTRDKHGFITKVFFGIVAINAISDLTIGGIDSTTAFMKFAVTCGAVVYRLRKQSQTDELEMNHKTR